MADLFEIQQARVASDPRQQWGWGPSPLASNEELDARRVAAGEKPRDIRNDPEFRQWAYTEGGYPKGRRQMRMQAEWQNQQDEELKRQAAIQAMDIQRKQTEINNAQETRAAALFQSGLDEARAKAKVDTETETQRARFDSGFAELDPRTPDFLDQLAALRKESPLAFVVPEVKGLVDQYIGINEVYRNQDEEKVAASVAKEALKNDNLSKLTKLAKLTGRNLSDLARSDIKTGDLIIDPIALGEAEAELAIKPAKEITDPAASVLRQEAKELRGDIRRIDTNIVTAQLNLRDAEKSKKQANIDAATTRLEELTAQRNLIATDLQGVEVVLSESGQEAPRPAAQEPTNAQIESARKAATDQNQSPVLRNAAMRFLENNGIKVDTAPPQPQVIQPQIDLATIPKPPPPAVPRPTPKQVLETSTDPLELAKASTQSAEQTSKAEQEKERQSYIARVEQAFAESPIPNPDVFQTPKAKEIAASPNARGLAQERYRELQSAAFTGGLRTALPKKKKEISDDVFEKVLAEMFELRVLLGESPRDAQDLIDRIRSNK